MFSGTAQLLLCRFVLGNLPSTVNIDLLLEDLTLRRLRFASIG
jgi:hypothetical protein